LDRSFQGRVWNICRRCRGGLFRLRLKGKDKGKGRLVEDLRLLRPRLLLRRPPLPRPPPLAMETALLPSAMGIMHPSPRRKAGVPNRRLSLDLRISKKCRVEGIMRSMAARLVPIMLVLEGMAGVGVGFRDMGSSLHFTSRICMGIISNMDMAGVMDMSMGPRRRCMSRLVWGWGLGWVCCRLQ